MTQQHKKLTIALKMILPARCTGSSMPAFKKPFIDAVKNDDTTRPWL
jgi:hypothetical protein